MAAGSACDDGRQRGELRRAAVRRPRPAPGAATGAAVAAGFGAAAVGAGAGVAAGAGAAAARRARGAGAIGSALPASAISACPVTHTGVWVLVRE